MPTTGEFIYVGGIAVLVFPLAILYAIQLWYESKPPTNPYAVEVEPIQAAGVVVNAPKHPVAGIMGGATGLGTGSGNKKPTPPAPVIGSPSAAPGQLSPNIVATTKGGAVIGGGSGGSSPQVGGSMKADLYIAKAVAARTDAVVARGGTTTSLFGTPGTKTPGGRKTPGTGPITVNVAPPPGAAAAAAHDAAIEAYKAKLIAGSNSNAGVGAGVRDEEMIPRAGPAAPRPMAVAPPSPTASVNAAAAAAVTAGANSNTGTSPTGAAPVLGVNVVSPTQTSPETPITPNNHLPSNHSPNHATSNHSRVASNIVSSPTNAGAGHYHFTQSIGGGGVSVYGVSNVNIGVLTSGNGKVIGSNGNGGSHQPMNNNNTLNNFEGGEVSVPNGLGRHYHNNNNKPGGSDNEKDEVKSRIDDTIGGGKDAAHTGTGVGGGVRTIGSVVRTTTGHTLMVRPRASIVRDGAQTPGVEMVDPNSKGHTPGAPAAGKLTPNQHTVVGHASPGGGSGERQAVVIMTTPIGGKESVVVSTGPVPMDKRKPRVEKYSLPYWLHRIGAAMSGSAMLGMIDPEGTFGIMPYVVIQANQALFVCLVMEALTVWVRFTVMVLYREAQKVMPAWFTPALVVTPIVYQIVLVCVALIPMDVTGLASYEIGEYAILIIYLLVTLGIILYIYFSVSRVLAKFVASVQRAEAGKAANASRGIDTSHVKKALTTLRRFVMFICLTDVVLLAVYIPPMISLIMAVSEDPSKPLKARPTVVTSANVAGTLVILSFSWAVLYMSWVPLTASRKIHAITPITPGVGAGPGGGAFAVALQPPQAGPDTEGSGHDGSVLTSKPAGVLSR